MLWTVIFILIFPAAFLLVLLLLSPHRFRRHTNRVVHKVLFSNFYILPPGLSFIKLILSCLIVVFLVQTYSVYKHAQQGKSSVPGGGPAHPTGGGGVDGVLLQSKGWRSQRNLYLTSLTLVLWWMLYSVHVLSEQLAQLQEQLDDALASRKSAQGAQGSDSGVGADKPAAAAVASDATAATAAKKLK